MKTTEQIDKLFLELSQFTRATTERELKLANILKNVLELRPYQKEVSPEFLEVWDSAIIALDCMGIHVNGIHYENT